jgi:hypothetical protein
MVNVNVDPTPSWLLTQDPPTVELDELPAQREPEPSALHLLVRRPDLPELLEHRLLILRRDPDACIADGDFSQAVLWRRSHLDTPALGSELDHI